MHTYKNVIVEKEMNGLLKIVKNPVHVFLNFDLSKPSIGTATLRQNQHGLFADLKLTVDCYGLYPAISYQSEPPTGEILCLGITTNNVDPSISMLKFSEEELSESNNDESEDRYHR